MGWKSSLCASGHQAWVSQAVAVGKGRLQLTSGHAVPLLRLVFPCQEQMEQRTGIEKEATAVLRKSKSGRYGDWGGVEELTFCTSLPNRGCQAGAVGKWGLTQMLASRTAAAPAMLQAQILAPGLDGNRGMWIPPSPVSTGAAQEAIWDKKEAEACCPIHSSPVRSWWRERSGQGKIWEGLCRGKLITG